MARPRGAARGSASAMLGMPELAEKRTVTGTSCLKCNALLTLAASALGTNLPRRTTPLAWAARCVVCLPNAEPRAAPGGLAIRFRLPDGSDPDLVTHSYNGFPAKNPEEFQQFFLAIAASKPGVPSPTPIEAFQETHPAARAFLTTRDPPPVSYATTTYFGVNSFKFVNEKGAVPIGRYQLLPDAGRFLVEGRERQGGDQLSRRRDSPTHCPWSGPIRGGAAARSAGRQDRRSIGGLGEHKQDHDAGDADHRFRGAGQRGDQTRAHVLAGALACRH